MTSIKSEDGLIHGWDRSNPEEWHHNTRRNTINTTPAMPPVNSYVTIIETGRVGRVRAHVGPATAPVLAAIDLGDSVQMCVAAEMEPCNPAYTAVNSDGRYWPNKPNPLMWFGIVAVLIGFLGSLFVPGVEVLGLMIVGGIVAVIVGLIWSWIPRRR